MKNKPAEQYAFKVKEGRYYVYINGYIAFCFNQLDFKGFYAFKDDVSLYGLDIYLMNEKGGQTRMEIFFKTRETWLGVLKLLDDNLA